MPKEKLERRKSLDHLDKDKGIGGGNEQLRGQLRRAQSFDEGQRHLMPLPERNAPVQGGPPPQQLMENQLAPEELLQGGEPQVLPELPLEGLNEQQPGQEGPGNEPLPELQREPERDPFADKPPAQNPQPGYSHIHVSSANIRMPMGQFDRRSKTEYDTIKRELEQKKGRSVKDREVRYAMVKRRVQSASEERARTGGDETLGIFTAPEGMLGDNLKKKDVRWYREKFAKLSGKNPHMAIMPGTMAWQERRKKEGKKFAKETVLRTTGDVFHGGQRVHSVDKRDDGGDTTGVKALHRPFGPTVPRERAQKWFTRGKDGGTTFNIGGVNMAYEICQDHSNDRARQELHDKGEGGQDVHIVNSMGNSLQDRHLALREGGIGIGSDGDRGDSSLVRAQEDWDPQDETPVRIPTKNEPVPSYLGKPIEAPKKITPLPTTFDSQQNPYQREHYGRFRLPGR